MKPEEFCNEFHKLDLRILENCLKVTAGCQHVYNLAADMGGMGFIVSNQAVLLYNNTMISFNMLEAARQNHAMRYFYSSTACVYNEALQMDPENPGTCGQREKVKIDGLFCFVLTKLYVKYWEIMNVFHLLR